MRLQDQKFRVWNKKLKRFECRNVYVIQALPYLRGLNRNKFEVDQWIGLHDINNRMIYANDYIAHDRYKGEKPITAYCLVEWDGGRAYHEKGSNPAAFNTNPEWTGEPLHSAFRDLTFFWSVFNSCTIVGNVWESEVIEKPHTVEIVRYGKTKTLP